MPPGLSIGMSGGFKIASIEQYEVVPWDKVTLKVEIPVRVGMFLHWLNDLKTDPDAKMEFRDEVLSGEVTISNIRLK